MEAIWNKVVIRLSHKLKQQVSLKQVTFLYSRIPIFKKVQVEI